MTDFVDTLSVDIPSKPKRAIAGFWRRFFAFVIDELVVSIPCWIIGLMFFDVFSRWEWFGFIVGAFITWPYFALMGSRVGNGQTVGMRALGIRVVDRGNHPLSVGRSFVRYVLLILPFTFNSSVLPWSLPALVVTIIDTTVMAAGFSIFYLYLFNTRTRQSLHDLSVGSYVVNAEQEGPIEAAPFWRTHLAILSTIFVCTIIVAVLLQPRIEQSAVIAEATSIQKALLATGRIQSAGVMIQETWFNGETAHGIQLTLQCNETPTDYQRLASDFAKVALDSDPQAAKKNFIRVTFVQAFNVGLAKFNKSWTDSKSPEEWKQLSH